MSKMQYRPEIDGIRAIAVLSVVIFHSGLGILKGGFLGVDLFFVISGYLITRILISDLESGTFSIITFYERRIRRIMPALFVMLGAQLHSRMVSDEPDPYGRPFAQHGGRRDLHLQQPVLARIRLF